MRREESAAAHLQRLGPFLCWAIVYADIGTSIYYVPGILYRQVGTSTATFVLATSLAFILLAEKYAEIAARYPSGGGVVSAAEEAFGARMGALGGMLILVDYFLTAAISAVSGFIYLGSLAPVLHGYEPLLAAAGLIGLGALNWVGIRESAQVSATIACAAFGVLLILVLVTAMKVDAAQWQAIARALTAASRIPIGDAVIGYSAAWLAFSGLESLAQISPAMKQPRRRTGGIAMALVVLAILITSPLLTAFATNLLDLRHVEPDTFQSELGFAFGGAPLRVLVVITASSLLLFASNTAIVGAYHVFSALADNGFLPQTLLRRSAKFGTPYVAIIFSVAIPVAVLFVTRGDMATLGELYAFGLLGAFVMSSISLDRIRIAEGRTGPLFALGILTTVLVGLAWATNLIEKPRATVFGGSLTVLMLSFGLLYRSGVPGVRRGAAVTTDEAERIAAETPEAAQILSVGEAVELLPTYSPKTLVCVRGTNQRLLEEAAARLAGLKQRDVAVLFVEEVPGLFVPRDTRPSADARAVLEESVAWLNARGLTAVPIWRLAQDAGEAIADTARKLQVDTIMVGTSQRGAIWRVLRGNVLARLIARIPRETRLLIVG